MKALLVSLSYPPVGGPALERTLDLATALPALGIETHVLAPGDSPGTSGEPAARVPTQAWVHRMRPVGVDSGAAALGAESISWSIVGAPAAIRLVRSQAIDAVVTLGPPQSVHLIGVAVRQVTGALWLADLGERPGGRISWLVRRQVDAIASGPDAIAAAILGRCSPEHLVASGGGAVEEA